MLKHFLSVSLLLSMIVVARAVDVSAAAFPAMLDRYYEEYLALFPVEAAINGDNDARYETVWPNSISAEHRAKVTALCEKYLGELAAVDRAALGVTDRLSHDTLKWNLEIRRDGAAQFFHLLPVNQFSCDTLTFAQMGSGTYLHPFKTAQDYDNFLRRGADFSAWVDTAIANMRQGMAWGFTQPRVLMERVLSQLAPLMADDESANVFFGPLKVLPAGLSNADQAKLASEYRAGLRAIVLPAYARLHDFIRDEYLKNCRDTAGLGALPSGAEAYAYLVRLQTTTGLTPAEIHETGLREVARIRGEMAKVQAQVGFAGSLGDFLQFVATDPQFAPFRSEEAVLDAYRSVEARVMTAVPKFFGRLPKTKFGIRATESFRAATASHEYIAGSADGTRPGVFFVPVTDPTKYRTPRMENLFLHEAIPGHHFQLSLALENTNLPRFRRYDANNAYVEGWALYTESLGRELGIYTDPYQYLGMLFGDMNRAIRLVVDTGLHAQGWTREQAMAFAAENSGGSPEAQASAIERYMALPGQALGYKIGQLKIRELRTRAEAQLGAKFDLRAFHDEVLGEGALPLAVLEAHLQAWMDRVATAK